MSEKNVAWFVASRGMDRHKDYSWIAERDVTTSGRRQQLEYDTQEFVTGDGRVNAFLRRSDSGYELALWHLRHPDWPSDAENRPILAHIIGVGRDTQPALRKLGGLAVAALTQEPPSGLVQQADNERGFVVDFAVLEAWCKPQDLLAGEIGRTVHRLGGSLKSDAVTYDWILAVPSPSEGGGGRPKVRDGKRRRGVSLSS